MDLSAYRLTLVHTFRHCPDVSVVDGQTVHVRSPSLAASRVALDNVRSICARRRWLLRPQACFEEACVRVRFLLIDAGCPPGPDSRWETHYLALSDIRGRRSYLYTSQGELLPYA